MPASAGTYCGPVFRASRLSGRQLPKTINHYAVNSWGTVQGPQIPEVYSIKLLGSRTTNFGWTQYHLYIFMITEQISLLEQDLRL
jgi:hypothetical protein